MPQELREELGISPGDIFFVESEADSTGLYYARAENPFDGLAEHALAEHQAGRTRSLREFAHDEQIELDKAAVLPRSDPEQSRMIRFDARDVTR